MASPVEDQGARQLRAVTPSDTAPLTLGVCRALWIGVTGNVAVIACGDTVAVTIPNVPVGWLQVKAVFVMNTNTTASSIIAAY